MASRRCGATANDPRRSRSSRPAPTGTCSWSAARSPSSRSCWPSGSTCCAPTAAPRHPQERLTSTTTRPRSSRSGLSGPGSAGGGVLSGGSGWSSRTTSPRITVPLGRVGPRSRSAIATQRRRAGRRRSRRTARTSARTGGTVSSRPDRVGDETRGRTAAGRPGSAVRCRRSPRAREAGPVPVRRDQARPRVAPGRAQDQRGPSSDSTSWAGDDRAPPVAVRQCDRHRDLDARPHDDQEEGAASLTALGPTAPPSSPPRRWRIPHVVTWRQGLGDDRPAHLALAVLALHERDRYLDDAEPGRQRAAGQVDLEAVALGVHRAQVDRVQHVGAVGAEAGGRVADRHPQQRPRCRRCPPRERASRLRGQLTTRPPGTQREPMTQSASSRAASSRGRSWPGASRRRPSRRARRSRGRSAQSKPAR